MFFNSILTIFQKIFAQIYRKSFVLKNLDWLIFANILFTILFSLFAPSDSIGYFAIFAIILTSIKLLVKPNERFSLTLADKYLLIYFMFVLISVAGSSLLLLSIKGFCKTLIDSRAVIIIHYLWRCV